MANNKKRTQQITEHKIKKLFSVSIVSRFGAVDAAGNPVAPYKKIVKLKEDEDGEVLVKKMEKELESLGKNTHYILKRYKRSSKRINNFMTK